MLSRAGGSSVLDDRRLRLGADMRGHGTRREATVAALSVDEGRGRQCRINGTPALGRLFNGGERLRRVVVGNGAVGRVKVRAATSHAREA